MTFVVGRNHAPGLVDQHQRHLRRHLPLAAVEDAFHLVDEPEPKYQNAHIHATLGGDAVGVQQIGGIAVAEVAGAKALDIGGCGQRLGNDGVAAAGQARFGVHAHQHLAARRQQHDVVVDGVLGLVVAQPVHHGRPVGLLVVGVAAAELDHHVVGGEEADVGRPFVQVAHQDVDRALGLGHQLVAESGFLLIDHPSDQALLQLIEALAGLDQGGEDRRDLLGAADRRAGLDHLPQHPEIAQVAFAGLHAVHVVHQVVMCGHLGYS